MNEKTSSATQEKKRAVALLEKLPRGCRITDAAQVDISFPLPIAEMQQQRMELLGTTAALAQKTLQKLYRRIQSVADDIRAGGFPTQAEMVEAILQDED